MKCGRWRMRYRLTFPIRGNGCGWEAPLQSKWDSLQPETLFQIIALEPSFTKETYMNPEGGSVLFFVSLQRGVFRIDTEEVTSSERILIGRHEAFLIEKNGYRLTWFDTENNLLYQLDSDSLNQEEIIYIANNLS